MDQQLANREELEEEARLAVEIVSEAFHIYLVE